MIGEIAFNVICFKMIDVRLLPEAMAAITNSFSLSLITMLRTILAKGAHQSKIKTIIILAKLGPNTSTIAKANRLDGKVEAISARRIIILSSHPPT